VRLGKSRGGEVAVSLPEGGIDLDRHIEELRLRYMIEALDRTGGVQTRAAELLGMTFRSFRYFAKKYALSARDGSVGAVVLGVPADAVEDDAEFDEEGDVERQPALAHPTAEVKGRG
jgi:hypothetical protein